MSDSILFSVRDSLATVTLNRPEVFNSFNMSMSGAFIERLRHCAIEKDIRAVLITGNGKAFCAGQDLQEAIDNNGPGLKRIISEGFNPIIKLIRSLEKPVIAAVNGVAAGAGANIALACDLVVASEGASFIQAFSKIGLVPDSGGTFFLPRLMGFQKASALMMLGEKISASDAERMGMIYKVFHDVEFMERAIVLAISLSKMPTRGLALTKQLLNQSITNSLEQQLVLEEELQISASQTHDYKEGVSAFLEKRKAVFVGE
ncbi:MAG: enoyl-CoA hydratase-related protein [Flavobacteriales bacterium]|nr:enoyl-CoA hydratase-related protein [Flavobacteriales bacterium]